MSNRQKRLTPAEKERLKKLASYATCENLADRFGIGKRHVQRILAECPNCALCGSATPVGDNICQRCVEKDISGTISRKGYL